MITNGHKGEEWAKKIARGLCLGLVQMHKQNIAHRDIKPSNIMMKDENTPIIIDFGLSGTIPP